LKALDDEAVGFVREADGSLAEVAVGSEFGVVENRPNTREVRLMARQAGIPVHSGPGGNGGMP
jgi:hypothetical protein